MMQNVDREKRVLYGRRRGKALRPGQKALVAAELPGLTVQLTDDELDLKNIFGSELREYWLEIGFGSGEHLAWQAEHHADIGIIGCEPFLNGVATLLSKLKTAGSENVRIHSEAAELLMEKLPPASLNRAFLLFPDPWPKSGHNKRRFVSFANIEALARVLKDDAELRIATDHTDYGAWILWHMLRSEEFDWVCKTAGDWRHRKADWPPTRYEQKALDKGLQPVYYQLRRRPRP
ncbi:MAG: tRNA (guanosine(46)-N7)-methyltransferase TrmB [Rhizobiales bacterium]|nr:tRNA (guanosine(46)-N7)-methyltransferase TrmB [Hyphomicrobiales bacterium]